MAATDRAVAIAFKDVRVEKLGDEATPDDDKAVPCSTHFVSTSLLQSRKAKTELVCTNTRASLLL